MIKNVIFYISQVNIKVTQCQGHIKVKFTQYVLLSILNGSSDLYVLRMVHLRVKGILLDI